MPRLVYEIGTEEIPPRFIESALEQLESLARERLAAARLAFADVKTYATPRRMTLIVEDLATGQESHMREEQGPPANRALNPDGTFNQAAVGFARRWGVESSELQVRETPRGDYVFAVFHEEGRSTSVILAEMLPAITTALSFPKTMRWGTGSLRFGRPIRWLVALFGDDVVPFDLDGIKTDRFTRGHPILSPKPLILTSADEYEKALKGAKVIVDQHERRSLLIRQLKAIAKVHNARLGIEKSKGSTLASGSTALLEETVFLVEWPTATCGSFDPKYLVLPRPVLLEEMRKVQGFFPMEDLEGKLIARFVGVRDGGKAYLDQVTAGYEGVLRAKFEDATFFYQQDRKRTLESRLEQLKGVVFQSGMGTMYDKVQRLQELTKFIADELQLPDIDKINVNQAAKLCKADLVTELVVEITSLQGTMGREYALLDGESQTVADAIGEHYQPRFAGDILPTTLPGRIVALADKLDTLVTGLAAGLSVSGSEDPYGLRREAQAVVSLIVDGGIRLKIDDLIDKNYNDLKNQLENRAEKQKVNLKLEDLYIRMSGLVQPRLERILKETPPVGRGIRYDLVDAVLAIDSLDFNDAVKRAEALQHLSHRADFVSTVTTATRPANIIKWDKSRPLQEDDVLDVNLFKEDAEYELWQAFQQAQPRIKQCKDNGDYYSLFDILAKLGPIINRFFTDVLVMAEDAAVRENRLNLVKCVNGLFRHLADFRLIIQEAKE